MEADTIQACIIKKTQLSPRVVGLTLSAVDGNDLPQWEPGAHIELTLDISEGASEDDEKCYRQYSLCGNLKDLKTWEIAVLKEDASRGGSKYIHEGLNEGDVITVSMPKNHFPFKGGAFCQFIAGGIGITPLYAMIEHAKDMGLDWHLLYLARSNEDFIFLDKIKSIDPKRVTIHASSEQGQFQLETQLNNLPQNAIVYSCGPQGLLDALEQMHQLQSDPKWNLMFERFKVDAPVFDENKDKPITVTLSRSNKTIEVPADESILEALRKEGIRIKCSCRNGTCGTCETDVISGIPDHRDHVLSDDEREANETMMICVSRALSDELVLDI
ncbi:oxidoreductase [Oligella urethralis]|uniref:PDR/VanB family oxidoreductase n=1 Tax=Oligella urethralis TaxID=90245 RepID=UPI000CFEFAD3|nr:PDR/VanB family oxidoreductase [Oligella urethralis]AVL71411.1 oxidoreductase [Oligella urethralis]